jgi:hypothetical protein
MWKIIPKQYLLFETFKIRPLLETLVAALEFFQIIMPFSKFSRKVFKEYIVQTMMFKKNTYVLASTSTVSKCIPVGNVLTSR